MLTPLDIENKRFTKAIKGYNSNEVDEFLDELTVEYEKLYKENAELRNEVESNKKDLEHYRNVEHTLQNTLVMAQSTAEDIKSMAQKQADQIIRDAQNDARKAVDELNKEEFEIRRRLEDLRRQFDVYKAKMEALLISQLELLQDDKENKN